MIGMRKIIVLVSCFILWWCAVSQNDIQVCTEQECISVEIADTNEKRMQGLMYRESLDEKAGMLFVFLNDATHGFWMKNTLIPLDMIWIDKNLTIIDIQTAQPCVSEECPSYIPSGDARYVLEINANQSEKYGFRTWSKVELKNFITE